MAKTILITGCSSGIGYDAAHGLTKAGWKVFATCRSEDDCARLRSEGLTSFPLDLSDPASIEAGFHPWSMFSRHGWSKFGRRAQCVTHSHAGRY